MNAMGKLVSVLLFCTWFSGMANAQLPSYLKLCQKGPDFVKCAIQNGNAALPELIKGDKTLKIPNMLPLTFPEVTVDSGPNLKLKFTNLKVFGLDTVTLTDFGVDFDKHTIFLVLSAKKLELDGAYEVDGQIMVLPVQGSGNCNMVFENGNMKYQFNYNLETKDGVEYAIMDPTDTLEFQIEKAHFNFDNLFNGNKELGDNVNKFLNDNPQEIVQELRSTIVSMLSALARKIGAGVIEHISYKELFIE